MILPRWRTVSLVVGALLVLHIILSIHPTYRAHTTAGLLPSSWTTPTEVDENVHYNSWQPDASTPGTYIPSGDELRAAVAADRQEVLAREKANAVFVVLARNSDLNDLLSSMRQMEDRFNYWAGYDWVFLNDDDFTEDFKRFTQGQTKSKCMYGKIEPSHWHQPDWIDEEKATAARNEMVRNKIIYGHSVPYRNMCRFNSGFFFRHPLLASYDYYWRVEPNVKYFCDINYDPFLLLKETGKVYGFTLTLYEYIETIKTLWATTKEFIEKHPEYVHPNNSMGFISDDNGENYNLCHYWSNFEIGDLNFFRDEKYLKYFEHLDHAGGFYYERWGDAPVHSLAVSLFVDKEKIHFFNDIGYRHDPFQHCPGGEANTRGNCWCLPADNHDWEWYSCTKRYVDMFPDKFTDIRPS